MIMLIMSYLLILVYYILRLYQSADGTLDTLDYSGLVIVMQCVACSM